jgi:hypothetical protein
VELFFEIFGGVLVRGDGILISCRTHVELVYLLLYLRLCLWVFDFVSLSSYHNLATGVS